MVSQILGPVLKQEHARIEASTADSWAEIATVRWRMEDTEIEVGSPAAAAAATVSAVVLR